MTRLISNSEMQSFKWCRRQWWLNHFRGLELARPSLTGHRQTGTRGHAALAAWYQPEGLPRTDPREALELQMREEYETWLAGLPPDVDPDVLAGQVKDWQSDADLVRAMIEGYVQWVEETGADSDYEVVAPELPLKLLLLDEEETGDDVYLVGRLDAVLRRIHDGVLLFMDHKLLGGFPSATELRANEQMLTYELLLEGQDDDDLPDHVVGAVFNMLRRVKRTSRAKPPFYHREEIVHNQHERDAFRERLLGTVTQVLLAEELLNAGENPLRVVYPSPDSSCSWRCDYALVCPMFDDGSRAEDFLASWYRPKPVDDRYTDLNLEEPA